MVMFPLSSQFLGNTEVEAPKGTEVVKDAVRKLKVSQPLEDGRMRRMGMGLAGGGGGGDPFLVCNSQGAPACLSTNVRLVLPWVEGKANKMDF